MYPELVPAYGRDYKSKKEVISDWNLNKDFIYAETSQMINKKDAEKLRLKGFKIRYSNFRNIVVIEFKNGVWK